MRLPYSGTGLSSDGRVLFFVLDGILDKLEPSYIEALVFKIYKDAGFHVKGIHFSLNIPDCKSCTAECLTVYITCAAVKYASQI